MTKIKYDYILVDDDLLVRMTWELNAQVRNHKLKVYENPEDLKLDLSSIDLNTIFYIDSNLGKNVNGEDIKGEHLANELFDAGFMNLYLVTGYESSSFSHLKYIKGVFKKDPPKLP